VTCLTCEYIPRVSRLPVLIQDVGFSKGCWLRPRCMGTEAAKRCSGTGFNQQKPINQPVKQMGRQES
jgi:hypothetical protein